MLRFTFSPFPITLPILGKIGSQRVAANRLFFWFLVGFFGYKSNTSHWSLSLFGVMLFWFSLERISHVQNICG